MAEHDYDSLGYNGLSKRLFAVWYDLLNAGVENRVTKSVLASARKMDRRTTKSG